LQGTTLMKASTTSIVLPCTPDTFWAAFVDESYLRALYLEELEYRAFAVIESGETSRKLRIVPKISLPAPVARLIGESFAYEEHGTLDRARSEWTWRMVQPASKWLATDKAGAPTIYASRRKCSASAG